jgi:hypothetical protein
METPIPVANRETDLIIGYAKEGFVRLVNSVPNLPIFLSWQNRLTPAEVDEGSQPRRGRVLDLEHS